MKLSQERKVCIGAMVFMIMGLMFCWAKTASARGGRLSGDFLELQEQATPGVSPAGFDRLWADTATHKLKASINNGAFVVVPTVGGGDIDLGSSTVTGTATIARGGTNSSTALSGSSTMVSDGTKIIQGFTNFSGPASTIKTFTLPNAAAKILTDNAAVLATEGGTGTGSYAVGDTLYSNGINALTKLSANTTATTQFMRSVSPSPYVGWARIAYSDFDMNAGTMLVGQAGNGAPSAVTPSGDLTVSNAGAFTIAAGAVTLPKLESRARPPFNLIINGGMKYDQRKGGTGDAGVLLGTDAYRQDRWKISGENNDITVTRTDTSGALETGLSARYYTVLAKKTNTGKMMISQAIESSNTFDMAGRTVTFQAKLKSSTAKPIRLGLMYINSTGTIDSLPVTVPATWGAASTDPTLDTKLTRLAPSAVPTGAQGTVNGNAVDCSVTTSWQLFAGTFTVPTSATTVKNLVPCIWTDGQFAAAVSLSISEVQFTDGGSVRDWLPRPDGQELALCQRYFEKSFAIDTAPADGVGIIGNTLCGVQYLGASISQTLIATAQFSVTKRATPTIALFNPAGGTAGQIRNLNGSTDWTSSVSGTASTAGFTVVGTSNGGSAKGDGSCVNWKADSEL
jgi:hypothetical protein